MNDQKKHWEAVYTTKASEDVSWFQEVPALSLRMLRAIQPPKDARILDVGGGDSRFVDHLLAEGYQDITVLDLSEAAIQKAKERLKDRASQVQWVAADILDFEPIESFDIWHDRAAFHFLVTPEAIEHYLSIADQALSPQGRMILATFAADGPDRCSGLPVHRYSEEQLASALQTRFRKEECVEEIHQTPSKKAQNFLCCRFQKPARSENLPRPSTARS